MRTMHPTRLMMQVVALSCPVLPEVQFDQIWHLRKEGSESSVQYKRVEELLQVNALSRTLTHSLHDGYGTRT